MSFLEWKDQRLQELSDAVAWQGFMVALDRVRLPLDVQLFISLQEGIEVKGGTVSQTVFDGALALDYYASLGSWAREILGDPPEGLYSFNTVESSMGNGHLRFCRAYVLAPGGHIRGTVKSYVQEGIAREEFRTYRHLERELIAAGPHQFSGELIGIPKPDLVRTVAVFDVQRGNFPANARDRYIEADVTFKVPRHVAHSHYGAGSRGVLGFDCFRKARIQFELDDRLEPGEIRRIHYFDPTS